MTDKPAESFGLTPGVVNMAWQFVGRTGRFAEMVPEPAREGVRRALALAYFYFESTPGRTPTEEMARNMAAVAMPEAYERPTGASLSSGGPKRSARRRPSATSTRRCGPELTAKAALSCFLSTGGVGNGEPSANEHTVWWDIIERPEMGRSLGLSLPPG